MNFKKWLESEYARDTLSADLHHQHQDVQDRIKASSAFIGGQPMSIFYNGNEEEKITPIELPKNKRIVVSAYRTPPIVQHLGNLDAREDRWHGRKPFGGLWYAFGNSWIDFAHGNMPSRLLMFVHEIYLDTNKIAKINSEKSRKEFEIKYGWVGNSDKQSGGNLSKYKGEEHPRSLWINWQDVMKDYDGVELTDEGLYNQNWSEGWDIPSGCIWNKNALKDSKLLYVYNVKTKNYVKTSELGLYAGKSTKIKNANPNSLG